jgi:hypothetical protein
MSMLNFAMAAVGQKKGSLGRILAGPLAPPTTVLHSVKGPLPREGTLVRLSPWE